MNQTSLLQRLPQLATLAVTMLVIALLGYRGFAFWQEMQSMDRPLPGTKQTQITERQARPAGTLAAYNLFGAPRAASQPEPKPTEDLPETNLRLTLRGVSASGLEEVGGALVEGPDRQTDFFRIGEEMPGNARLHSVYANRIVIDRKGSLENLYFPETSDDSGVVEIYEPPAEDPRYEDTTEYPEPQYIEPDYPEPQYVEPDYSPYDGAADGGQDLQNAPALNGLDEQRRAEIRDRLQQLREQIRTDNAD